MEHESDNIKISNIRVNKAQGKIFVSCRSENLISYEDFKKFTDDFEKKINRTGFYYEYTCSGNYEEDAEKDPKCFILKAAEHCTEDDRLALELLKNCDCSLHKGVFTVKGPEKTISLLKAMGISGKFSSFISKTFGSFGSLSLEVSEDAEARSFPQEDIQDNGINENDIPKYVQNTAVSSDEQKKDARKTYEKRRNSSYSRKKRLLTPKEGSEPEKDEDGNIIFKGRSFDEKYNRAEDMKKIGELSEVFYYFGKIFEFELKQIKKTGENGEERDINIVTFGLTDGRDSVPVQFFIDTEDVAYTKKMLENGKYVKIAGKCLENTYGRDRYYYVRPDSIIMMPAPPERMDRAEVKRVELHLHTTMSQQDAVTDPEALVRRAVSWDVPALAITDHGCVQAFPFIQRELNKINSERKKNGQDPSPLKIIFGMEAYITNTQRGVSEASLGKKHISYHCIILVKNKTGLKNLYKLVSKSNLEHFYRHPNIPKYELDELREGLLIGSACSEGELYKGITEGKTDEELLKIASYYDYLEIQPVGNNKYLEKEGFGEADIKKMNLKVVELADTLGKMTVATCDSHFLDPEDDIFRAVMQGGLGYDDFNEQPPLYYRTTDEMLAEFDYLGDRAYEIVVENTRKISEMTERIVPIPTGYYPPSIEGSDDKLRDSCYDKAHSLYGEVLPDIIKTRLDTELDMIIGQGYSVMYIAAKELVENSARNGYQVGSRGSVGSSIAAYMAGITEVNALPAHYRCPKCKYSEFPEDGDFDCGYDLPDKTCPVCGEKLVKEGFNIPFETFLGFKDKTKTPDIDLNFAPQDQPNAHAFTAVIFGADSVFRAGTIAKIKEKTAMGYVKKYLERNDIVPESVSHIEKERLALGFTGVKRTTGQHPGGIMVIPKDMDIYDFTPIQYPAEKMNSGTITTQFDYHFLHDNILKLDILGHDGPEMIKLLENFTGISSRDIPLDDPKMLSIFSGTEALSFNKSKEKIEFKFGTTGIPEFGTNFTMKMLAETMPTTVTELVRIAGLSHGTNVWNDNAQKLIREGTCKLSQAICCRDDIMVYLISKGLPTGESFAIMEAVRKGKGLTPDWEKLMREHNVPDWYIWSCNKIEYMFPKAHAVAYVMLSLRIAWYKVYHPLAYYCAYFTQKVGDFDAANMIHGAQTAYSALKRQMGISDEDEENADDEIVDDDMEGGGGDDSEEEGSADVEKDRISLLRAVLEMYQRDIEFLPIDLYKSDAYKFIPEDGAVRPPFASIVGVGEAAAESIVKARKETESFLSVDDLKTRAKIPKSVIDALESEGCLRGLPESNQISLFDF